MNLSKVCKPALVYLVLSIISVIVIIMKKMTALTVITKILFVLLWTFFLDFLCKKGYKSVSWFLVLLPFLVMLGTFLMALEVVKTNNTNTKNENKKQ